MAPLLRAAALLAIILVVQPIFATARVSGGALKDKISSVEFETNAENNPGRALLSADAVYTDYSNQLVTWQLKTQSSIVYAQNVVKVTCPPPNSAAYIYPGCFTAAVGNPGANTFRGQSVTNTYCKTIQGHPYPGCSTKI